MELICAMDYACNRLSMQDLYSIWIMNTMNNVCGRHVCDGLFTRSLCALVNAIECKQ